MFAQWLANLTKSPKTSIGGLIAAIIIAMPQIANMTGSPVPEMLDGRPVLDENGQIVYQEPEPVHWATLVLAGSILWLGAQSRDGDKKSEQVIQK